MKKQHAIAAAVAAVVLFFVVRKAKAAPSKLVCGAGATFKATTDTSGWAASSPTLAQIKKYGGYCVKQGYVSDAGTTPYGTDDSTGGTPAPEPSSGDPADSDGGVWNDETWDGEDQGAVTHPWQVP